MTWLIITVVLLVAFGPMLWLMPSRRDKRLAALRLAARKAGLNVAIEHLPKLNPSAEDRVSAGGVIREPVFDCAAYSHILGRRLHLLPQWRLLKDAQGSDGPLPGWTFNPTPERANPYWPALWECFAGFFDALPEDAVGVELQERSIVLYWLESPASDVESVTRMAEVFRDLGARIEELETRLEAELEDADS
jgi:hypothetical protein